MIRPVKKNTKKKLTTAKPAIPVHRPTMIIHPNDITAKLIKPAIQPQIKQEIVSEHHQFIHHNSGNLLASSQSSYGSMTSDDMYLKQDLMTICENSYESSEDTGVGGLSENELMSHDVIEPFDMESCAELSKALSSLPTNALDDLLTGECSATGFSLKKQKSPDSSGAESVCVQLSRNSRGNLHASLGRT